MSRTFASETASRNAELVVQYLTEHGASTVAAMVHRGMMTAHEAHEALQQGIRHGVITREKRPNAPPAERVRYVLTGVPLAREEAPSFSFDALLDAWGMVRGTAQRAHWPASRQVVLGQ